MGCEATEIQFGELAMHLKQSMPKHLELLCVRIHRNAQILAEQQTLLEKLIQRSPLEVRAGGGAAPFATIGEALDAAEDGDRIVVHEGSYRETLVIEKRVTLQAAGTVRVENATEGNVIVSRVTCTITGFTLQQRSKNFFCIRVMGVDNNTLIDACDISSDHFSCVQIDSGCNPTVRGSKIHDSRQCGVLIKKNGKGCIQDNDIYSNFLANIYVDANADPIVTGNKIHHSAQHGVWVKQHGLGQFEANSIYGNAMSNMKVEEGAMPRLLENALS